MIRFANSSGSIRLIILPKKSWQWCARMELKRLVSHCGLYCGACRPYLMLKKGLLERRGYKVGCKGCWVQNKNCAFIMKKCPRLRKKKIDFCFECDRFPCDILKPLDTRYRKNYGVSLIKNLERMREIGVEKWVEEQQQFYKCRKCGGEICVHDDECFDCGNHYNPNKI